MRKGARESADHSFLGPLFSQSLPSNRDANRHLLCQSYLTSETQFPHPGQKSQNRQRSSFSVWWEEEICKQRIRKTDGMGLSLPCREDLLPDLSRRCFLSAGPEFQALVEELFQLSGQPRKKGNLEGTTRATNERHYASINPKYKNLSFLIIPKPQTPRRFHDVNFSNFTFPL